MVDGKWQLKVRAIASAGFFFFFNVYASEMVPLDIGKYMSITFFM